MMKKLLLISLFSLVISSLFAGPIVIHWRGRYLKDSHGKWHCLKGGGHGCIGPRLGSSGDQVKSIEHLGIEDGILVFQDNRWFIVVSKEVYASPETARYFTTKKVKYFNPTIQEDALLEIDKVKFKNKILVGSGLAYPANPPKNTYGDQVVWLELRNPKLKDLSK